ncbi:5-methyltetrahydropteroyltriglutamate/homocysteine S-methyltransferase [Streptococcus pneumoniae]|nr:5-methyltetrahydropteroyltriglutamate/homocysteine S-methyltransferase [Streptococcus pneumoniae]
MSTTIIGFPRLGEFRELKFTTEKYFRKEISEEELLAAAKDLRAKHWNIVKEKGITEIPSNDFSHYDNFLDAAFLFNVVPASVQNLDLVTQDVAGVHLYTMNNADTAKYIHQATHALFNHQSLG